MSITQDLRGDWQIRGRVGEAVAEFSAQNLPGAMNVADRFVLDHGGVKGYLKRDTKWRGEPPTEKQISAMPNPAHRPCLQGQRRALFPPR